VPNIIGSAPYVHADAGSAASVPQLAGQELTPGASATHSVS
jgi:hypothetical protein